MKNENNFDSLHFHDAFEFIQLLPDIARNINVIATEYPSFHKDLFRFFCFCTAYVVPFADTRKLLGLVSTLHKYLVTRYKRKDCPPLSPDEACDILCDFTKFVDVVITDVNKYSMLEDRVSISDILRSFELQKYLDNINHSVNKFSSSIGHVVKD